MLRKKPLVRLYLPISHSIPSSPGPCPLSQKWFMIYHLLVEQNVIRLCVIPISPNVPPIGYSQLNVGRRLPLVTVSEPGDRHNQLHQSQDSLHSVLNNVTRRSRSECRSSIIAELEEDRDNLLTYWNVPGFVAVSEQLPLICDLASSLNQLLLYGHTTLLLKCLHSLNEHLKITNKRYLDSDTPSYADCALAPKLQHLRVAGAYFRGFYIPNAHLHLWSYISRIYQLEAFLESCPTDRDILLHYVERIMGNELSELSKQKSRILRIPEDFRLLTCPVLSQLPSPTQPELEWNECSKTCLTDQEIKKSDAVVKGLRKFSNMTNLVEIDSPYSKLKNHSSNTSESGINRSLKNGSSTSIHTLDYLSPSVRPNPLYRNIPPSRYFNSLRSSR